MVFNGCVFDGGWLLIRQNGDCLSPHRPHEKAIRQVQLSQIPRVTAKFDETNLIAHAGLVPVMALARRGGLAARVATGLTLHQL